MITIKDKQFVPFMTAAELDGVIKRLASEISHDYRNLDPLVCPVLSGSFLFAADLVRALDFDPEISFVKYSSYAGTESTGKVNRLIGFPQKVEGRHVLIVEDIVETGISMREMLNDIELLHPASVRVCTLMNKPSCMKVEVPLSYVGCRIPDAFIVGYGFDYDGHGRTYPDIYQLKQ